MHGRFQYLIQNKTFLSVFECNMCRGPFQYIVFCHSYSCYSCSSAAGLSVLNMSSITVCFEWWRHRTTWHAFFFLLLLLRWFDWSSPEESAQWGQDHRSHFIILTAKGAGASVFIYFFFFKYCRCSLVVEVSTPWGSVELRPPKPSWFFSISYFG